MEEPGGICVSGKVAKEVEKKLAFGFESMGEQKVKNIAEPIPTFRVKLEGPPTRRPSMRRRILPWQAVAAAVIAIIVIVGTWFAYVQTGPPAQTPIATVPSVAVLPFDNMSGDSAMAYFADGVSEDIISMLSRSPDVLVVARNSSFTYKGKATDARQIGKELNVGYVLEGSVRKEADKVRIVAQLIDAKTGEQFYENRTHDGRYRTSPLFADGKIYVASRPGVVTVVKAGKEFEVLSQNKMEEEISSSFAVSNGRIYIRTWKALYAIGGPTN